MAGMFPDSGVPASDAINSLPDPDTVNCPEELWYSTARCQPRFDSAAANAVLAELINLVNCANLPYDCSKLDNLCTAVKDIFNDKLFGCLDLQFPFVSGACSVTKLVIAVDANGCEKISRYSESGSIIAGFSDWSVYPTNYSGYRPEFPSNAATFYQYTDLVNDIKAGTINETKLANNIVHQGSFSLNCNTGVYLNYSQSIVFAPKLNNGNGGASVLVTRLNNKFTLDQWDNIYPNCGVFTNFLSGHETNPGPYFLPAGTHFLQSYIVAFNTVPVQTAVRGEPLAPGGGIVVNLG